MTVLIVGRANVGKSSLFNRITRSRKALVFKEAGMTRDILKERVVWDNRSFDIMDSGGIPEEEKESELFVKVREKILLAIQKVDAFVLVTNGRQGVQPGDVEALNLIRKTGKPFLFFVNKVDDLRKTDLMTADFFYLAPQIVSGSCEKKYGMDAVQNWIVSLMPEEEERDSPSESGCLNNDLSERTEIFVMGKANSGKSLLCNQILNEDRMIVCSQPGTTLDTVRDFFSKNDEEYSIADNPGSRRGTREDREKLSFAKSRSEADKSHIILLVADGTKGVGRQEARLAELCLNRHKPVILVVNKVDLLREEELSKKDIQQQIEKTFRFYSDIPVIYMSAKTGKNKEKLFHIISEIKKKTHFRITTPQLNDFFTKVIRKAPSPVYGTSDVKFYYVTQTHKVPPSFIAFANYPKGVTPSYKKFVVNQIKKQWGLQGIPVQFHALPKNKS